jgi:WD40 repeat protein
MQLVLSGHDRFALLSMSPDGRYLLTADDTTARVWALDVDDLTTIARSRLTRGLTPAECVTYHVEDCA